MRLDEMPKVEVVVMPDGEFWGGSANRPSWLPRLRCSTPSLRQPASESAASRSKSAICVRPGDARGLSFDPAFVDAQRNWISRNRFVHLLYSFQHLRTYQRGAPS